MNNFVREKTGFEKVKFVQKQFDDVIHELIDLRKSSTPVVDAVTTEIIVNGQPYSSEIWRDVQGWFQKWNGCWSNEQVNSSNSWDVWDQYLLWFCSTLTKWVNHFHYGCGRRLVINLSKTEIGGVAVIDGILGRRQNR